MRSNMSLMGLYHYRPDILDRFHIPGDINDDMVRAEVIRQCAELEVLYPDPDFFKEALHWWSWSHNEAWERMYTALMAEYDPIENYNRIEDWTDDSTQTNDLKSENTGSATGNISTTGTNATDEKHYDKGFNEYALLNDQRNETNSNTTTNTTDSSTTGSTTRNTGSVDQTASRKGHVHGNIGVTTNQQMLSEEIKLRTTHTMTQIIVDQFKREFCLLVY